MSHDPDETARLRVILRAARHEITANWSHHEDCRIIDHEDCGPDDDGAWACCGREALPRAACQAAARTCSCGVSTMRVLLALDDDGPARARAIREEAVLAAAREFRDAAAAVPDGRLGGALDAVRREHAALVALTAAAKTLPTGGDHG